MSNSVKRVTIHVELEDGGAHTLVSSNPGVQGANPRFVGQQIEAALADLGERTMKLADLYGPQVR